MSEGLYEIPPDWRWEKMGDIADVIGGGTPKTNEPQNYENGDIPWLTPADMSGYEAKYVGHGRRMITAQGLKTSSARLMPAGTILFSSRAPIGYVAIASNPISTNQGFKNFVLKRDDLLPDYVYWWLKGNKALAESYASGTTFLELSGSKAKQLPIPIAPLEQQRRIVAEIEKQFSRLDEAVASLKRVKANLKRYKAAVLKAAVEGKLTEEWRKQNQDVEPASKLLERILAERRTKWEDAELDKMNSKGKAPKDDKWREKYKEPGLPTLVDSDALPECWVYAGIEQLLPPDRAAMKTGPFGSLLKKSEHRSAGIPVLGIENIAAMKFLHGSKIHITRKKSADLAGYAVVPGDVLVSRSGTVGEVCVVPLDIGEARISTNLMKISLAEGGLLPRFFTMLFNGSPQVLLQVRDLCKGSTRDFLNQDILKRLLFPLPPVDEQLAIFSLYDEAISDIDNSAVQVEAAIQRSASLRNSVLKAAFCGRVGSEPERSNA